MNPKQSNWGMFERLRPSQIDAIKGVAPIAYVPFGAIEWHSYHCPTGLDGIKAHGLLCELAASVGGLVLPALYVGTETIKPYKGFKHTIDYSAEIVERLALETLEQLADEGFRVIVLATGHCPQSQQDAIANAAKEFRVRFPDVGLWSGGDHEPTEDRFPANHAARGETNLQMHFAPETVDLTLLPADHPATLDDDGVWGEDPRLATSEQGREMARTFVEAMSPVVLRLLKGATR